MLQWLKNMRCWLFHIEHVEAWPIYHSWSFHCSKCGNEWIEKDF